VGLSIIYSYFEENNLCHYETRIAIDHQIFDCNGGCDGSLNYFADCIYVFCDEYEDTRTH